MSHPGAPEINLLLWEVGLTWIQALDQPLLSSRLLQCILNLLSVQHPSFFWKQQSSPPESHTCPLHHKTIYLCWDLQCYHIILFPNPKQVCFSSSISILLTAFHLKCIDPKVKCTSSKLKPSVLFSSCLTLVHKDKQSHCFDGRIF